MTLTEQFDDILARCKRLFTDKYKDYGTTWLIYRWESMADQLWIKGKRIRTLEEADDQCLIDEGRDAEYVGLINYSIIALIKFLHKQDAEHLEQMADIPYPELEVYYDDVVQRARNLMVKKNHDYGDAWRDMHIFSITDQILTKILRIKSIIKNSRKLTVSENIDAQLFDIINYSVFALIKMEGV